jgi:hypothetical protein
MLLFLNNQPQGTEAGAQGRPPELPFLANQYRLLLHTTAYCLFWLLRHHLQGTELATAQVNKIRPNVLSVRAFAPKNLHWASSSLLPLPPQAFTPLKTTPKLTLSSP